MSSWEQINMPPYYIISHPLREISSRKAPPTHGFTSNQMKVTKKRHMLKYIFASGRFFIQSITFWPGTTIGSWSSMKKINLVTSMILIVCNSPYTVQMFKVLSDAQDNHLKLICWQRFLSRPVPQSFSPKERHRGLH